MDVVNEDAAPLAGWHEDLVTLVEEPGNTLGWAAARQDTLRLRRIRHRQGVGTALELSENSSVEMRNVIGAARTGVASTVVAVEPRRDFLAVSLDEGMSLSLPYDPSFWRGKVVCSSAKSTSRRHWFAGSCCSHRSRFRVP